MHQCVCDRARPVPCWEFIALLRCTRLLAGFGEGKEKWGRDGSERGRGGTRGELIEGRLELLLSKNSDYSFAVATLSMRTLRFSAMDKPHPQTLETQTEQGTCKQVVVEMGVCCSPVIRALCSINGVG